MAIDLLAMLLLPAVFIVGAITSYEDIKLGRIRNKWIIFSLAYSLAALIIVVLFMYAQNEAINKSYIVIYFVNAAFAFLVGFLIWLFGLWSPGDAKLFFAYSVLVPLSLYSGSSADYFPSFAILAYTFVPFLVFYIIMVFFRTGSRLKLNVLNSMLKPKFLLDTIPFIFAFTWLGSLFLSYIGKYLPAANNFFIILLFLFIAPVFFANVLRIGYRKVGIALSLAAILFSYEMVFTLEFLRHFAIILVLFLFIRYFMLNLAFEVFSYPIYIEDLKPGMVIAENYLSKKGRYFKRKVAPLGFFSAMLGRSEGNLLLSSGSDGLTLKEAEKIKKLHSNGQIKGHTIRVFQTLPFAPFIFMGVLLIIALKGILSLKLL